MFHESLDTLRAPGPRRRRIRPDIPACPGDLRVRDRAGARHAFRVTCPGLFPVALSGLQEHARVAQGRFLPRLVSPGWRGWPRSGRGWMATSRPWAREHVGAAPCGCPSGSNGDTLSRRGRRLEHDPVLVRRLQTLRSVPNLFLSRARGLKTGFCFGRYSYDVPRHAYVGFRQGQEKTGFAPGRCFKPVPVLLRGVQTPRNLCPLWPISCCFRRWIPPRPSCSCVGANRGLPGRRWASCPAQGFCPSISECRTRRGWQ